MKEFEAAKKATHEAEQYAIIAATRAQEAAVKWAAAEEANKAAAEAHEIARRAEEEASTHESHVRVIRNHEYVDVLMLLTGDISLQYIYPSDNALVCSFRHPSMKVTLNGSQYKC